MSEYRHFIAYIYEYEDGKKKNNAGFVKVNIRNGICRMQMKIHISDRENAAYQVYGFFHAQSVLLGLKMGEAWMKKGSCETTILTPEKTFLEQGYSFSGMSGLWIQKEQEQSRQDHYFATVWDERSIDGKSFRTELIGQQEEKEEEKRAKEEKELEAQNKEAVIEEEGIKEKWEQFQYHYPHITPFQDEEITECLQIMPKDIQFLGEKEKDYACSPFVRQKYMKYQHLLIGRHKNGQYILAVPGLNRNTQDRNLAAMYGFGEFKEAGEEHFGYWYHFL